MKIIRKCRYCGKEFEVDSKSRRLLCSPECVKARDKQCRKLKDEGNGVRIGVNARIADKINVLKKYGYDVDISKIAKVQYEVCMQAGIYIPDEFIEDVIVIDSIVKNE